MLCQATKKSDGKPCTFKALEGSEYCGIHESRTITDLPNELALNIMEYADLNTLDILSKSSKFGSLVMTHKNISSRLAYLKKLEDLRNTMLHNAVQRMQIANIIDIVDHTAKFVLGPYTKKQYMELVSNIYSISHAGAHRAAISLSRKQAMLMLEYIATYSEQFAGADTKKRFDALMLPMVKHLEARTK
jgi:hypothetical protein